MELSRRSALCCLLFAAVVAFCSTPAAAQDDGLVVVSIAASPRVAYGLARESGEVVLTVSVDGTIGRPTVAAGLAAERSVRFVSSDARAETRAKTTLFVFRIPASRLVQEAANLDRLRVALDVTWQGGFAGAARQRERFLHTDARAPHSGLSHDPNDWREVSLIEFERAAHDRAQQIAIDFAQPFDGKATVVVDDAQGRRVRNLVSAAVMKQGAQRLVWDGLDDEGQIVPPGSYSWRAISHPGIRPHYQFSFANGPGSNHGTLHAASANRTSLFFGTSVSEGGFELVQLSPEGKFLQGFNAPHGHGLQRVAVAADEQYLYAAYDGTAWGQHVDRSTPDWQAEQQITLVRFHLARGVLEDYRPARAALVSKYVVGPGSPQKLPDRVALAGLANLNGRLYLADRVADAVYEIDPQAGAVARTITLKQPTALAANEKSLFAICGQELVQIELPSGAAKPVAVLKGEPAGLAVGPEQTFYVSDAADQTVQILDAKGDLVRTLGKPGGVAPGKYDPLRLHRPAGLVLAPDGHLWVTEEERWRPKRLAAYDPQAGAMWKEYFGPAAYGAPGLGFDPQTGVHWIGQNTLFQLDFAAKSATPLSILGGHDATHYRYWRQDGRTFLIGMGKVTWIQEFLKDGVLKPLACLSSGHQFSYSKHWNPPQAFVDAFNRDYPHQKYRRGEQGKPSHGFGMLWVDRNGDGEMQSEEIEFATTAESVGGSGWGHDFHDLTLRVAASVKGQPSLVTLRPDGWWPGGAPKYPPLNDAVKAAVPIDLPRKSVAVESTVDRFGTLVVNSDPQMCAFAPDGRRLWSYPNRWTNVHGSHDAPLPSPGELQGVLFFTGVAPLDEQSDVMVMNGNHGRAFVMTTDGLYLDEMFSDVRLMNNPQANGVYILGGECFGGCFGRSETDGAYYFQGGGIEYRIYRVEGLDAVRRSHGRLDVTAEQVLAAERSAAHATAEQVSVKAVRIPFRPAPDAKDARKAVVAWEKDGQFPVAIEAAHDGRTLHLKYSVRGDASPWVNNGKDWQQLFKTGDGVDLQLGSDPSANPRRSGPAPGDLRLFIAPFEGQPLAVLYRHRLPGATDSVVFQSPWRSEKVDSVRRLDSARININRTGDGYVVDAQIPLADLGLAQLPTQPLKIDFGVIYGDRAGTINLLRIYWANPSTGLVNDVPGEIMLSPHLWGEATFEEVKK